MVNNFSYRTTQALIAGAMLIFIVAPIVGMPSFGAFVISFSLAIIAGLLLVEYSRSFRPEPSDSEE